MLDARALLRLGLGVGGMEQRGWAVGGAACGRKLLARGGDGGRRWECAGAVQGRRTVMLFPKRPGAA